MSNTPRLSPTDIDYADLNWNPITGCYKGCEYCYAKPFTNRFKRNYPNGFEPTIYPSALLSPLNRKKPAIIFTGTMGDLFGPWEWLDEEWHGNTWLSKVVVSRVLEVAKEATQHQFLLLTKYPQNIINCLPLSVPQNVWIGTTITGNCDLHRLEELASAQRKTWFKSWISYEPMIGPLTDLEQYPWHTVGWWTLGAMTGRNIVLPHRKWIEDFLQAVWKGTANSPVWMKDSASLKGVWGNELVKQYPGPLAAIRSQGR